MANVFNDTHYCMDMLRLQGLSPSMASAQVAADVRTSGSCIILSALTAVSSTVLTLGELEPHTGRRMESL